MVILSNLGRFVLKSLFNLQTNSLDKRSRAKGASSWRLSMKTTRSWYAGEVAGMLNLTRGESPSSENTNEASRNAVANRLIDAVSRACHERNDQQHRAALWRATALLISVPGLHY